MATKFPIHDLYFRELDPIETDKLMRLPVLRFEDHLLRQFGYAEFIRAKSNTSSNSDVRESADEVWALLEGTVSFSWKDIRESSPTFKLEHRMTSTKPMLMLVPFGVAFGYQVEQDDALLLRFATHAPVDHLKDLPSTLETSK